MKRVAELDGLRGIAIALVLIWHYFANQAQLESAGWILHFTQLCWSGVDLFFVLSGFLIVSILLRHRNADHYYKAFYIRRVCRIVPIYYLLLGLTFALSPGSLQDGTLSWKSILHYATFTQNFAMAGWSDAPGTPNPIPGPHWLGVTWSLTIEEQFYLITPWLVKRLTTRQLAILFAVLSCAAPGFRMLFPNGAQELPFARADSILIGGLLAIAYADSSIRVALQERRGTIGKILGAVVIATILINVFPGGSQGDVWIHLWLGLFYALLVGGVLVGASSALNRILRARPLIWLGHRSYGIYLLHQPVSGCVHYWWHGGSPHFSDLESGIPTLFSLILTFLAAEILFRAVEAPILKIGHRVTYNSKPTHAATG